MKIDHSFLENFEYKHKNPYHDKLEEFSSFVFRDNEAENLQGKWNKEYFEKKSDIIAEIGCGYGEFMQQFCQDFPNKNFVGIDYRFKRSFSLAKKLSKLPSKNFCLLRAKGERISFLFGENEISELLYFFPDPWPKTRHQKKRLFQLPFLEEAYKVIRPGGKIYIKTDHDDYAMWIQDVIKSNKLFDLELASFDLRKEFPDHFLSKYKTKFEKIFIEQQIPIKAFVLTTKKK